MKNGKSNPVAERAASSSGSVEEFRAYIEKEVLEIIKVLADKGQTEPERIQDMAKLTLELIQPGMTLEQLYQNSVKLDDSYSELSPVVFKVMKQYEDKYEKKALEQVSSYIKSGNYDQAEDMVKKVLQFKIAN